MKKIDIGAAVKFGWEAIKKDFWYFIGLSAVYLALTSLPTYEERRTTFDILGFILSAWLTAGLMKIALSYYDKKKLKFTTIFTETKYFWQILGASLLIGLIIIGGLILFIVPGIYWALKYQFVINLIVDKDMGITEAMRESALLTKDVKWELFLFDLVMIGITILGALALFVGVIVAFPIVWLADIYIYKKLSAKN